MASNSHDGWEQYKQQVLAGLAAVKFAPVYGGLDRAKPSGEDWMLACCPLHEDENPSFGYNTASGQWNCFSSKCGQGDVFQFLERTTGKSFKEVLLSLGDGLGLPRPSSNGDGSGQTVYQYRDERGALLHEVLRGAGKRFYQRRPDGNGGWIKNLKGVRRVLYRLPELLARPSEAVFVVEGEKDADRLHAAGLLATTNSGGAGKWKQTHSESLRGRAVVILPDNDAPGREHGQRVARSLHGVAASVKIIELPDLPEKGDCSDWLDAGHTVAELLALVEATAHADPGKEKSGSGAFPVIVISDRQMRDIVADAWQAVLARNEPPRLFISSGLLARLVTGDSGPSLQYLDSAAAYGVLMRAANWFAERGGGIRDAKPPQEVARDILSNPHADLPPLDAIVTTPVFDAAGHLLLEPGYHRAAQLWFHRTAGMEALQIPNHPTDDDVASALTLLCQDLLVDFPFTAESDQAHALAALILPFVRRMIVGPTPIHLIEAPTPGSGKGLLADLVSLVALGRPGEATTVTKDEDESRKKLTAILSRGRPVVVFDNVQGGLESAQLAAAITAETWSDRILGRTQMVELPNRAVWLATGNNPKLSLEIARRCVRIRLEPTEERPWERTKFKHDPLRLWASEHRLDLVRAILTLVQHWLAAGRPVGKKTLGSFESWAATIGGILRLAGITEFLHDTTEFYTAADPDSGEWRAFVQAWWDKHGGETVSARELIELAEANDLVAFAYAAKSEQAQRVRFGRALSGLRGRKFGDLQVSVAENSNRKIHAYRLVRVSGDLFNDREPF